MDKAKQIIYEHSARAYANGAYINVAAINVSVSRGKELGVEDYWSYCGTTGIFQPVDSRKPAIREGL